MSAKFDPDKERPTGQTTRERLVQAAREVVAERGWSAATSRAIAQQAQANPALINYYFNSKDLLLEAMVQDSLARLSTELGEDAVMGGISLSQVMLESARSMRSDEFSHDRTVLLEAANQASRDPRLGALALEQLELFRSFLADVIRAPLQACEEQDSKAWATVVAALLDGLALHAQVDPELDAEKCVRLFQARLQAGIQEEGQG